MADSDVKRSKTRIPIDYGGRHFSNICISSGYLTSSQIVTSNEAMLVHVEVISDGSNSATAVVHDGPDGTGNELFHAYASGTDVIGGGVHLNIRALGGLYLSLTGANAKAIVHYVTIDN